MVNNFKSKDEFLEGAVILIDKPLGWTSFDAVNKVKSMLKYRLGLKKIKVGHAGTLDPMATGLLVICTGKMTKQIQYIQADEKGYTGQFKFGVTTVSFDREADETEFFPTEHLSLQFLQEKALGFEPGYDQMPPQFSARKVDGQRAYLAARKGKNVELTSNFVEIRDFKLYDYNLPFVNFDVTCSKGTYIRSLAFDLGVAANSGAYLTGLRRYRSGNYHVDDAFTFESLESWMNAFAESSNA